MSFVSCGAGQTSTDDTDDEASCEHFAGEVCQCLPIHILQLLLLQAPPRIKTQAVLSGWSTDWGGDVGRVRWRGGLQAAETAAAPLTRCR